MTGFASSPLRNIILGVVYIVVVGCAATLGYMDAGWSLADSAYMVVITVFSVGYGEVHPVVADPFLRNLTMALIVLGCTGMIYLTGALVQFITMAQVQNLLGVRTMNRQIAALRDHVIVCGFGRLGQQLSIELKAGLAEFVILEQSPERCAEARALGFLCLEADATDEDVLLKAGVERARALASVVPSDAVNVFITLCARGLNPAMQIIARSESPTTEKKLIQAGANAVVRPAHISAEHAAALILFPALVGASDPSDRRRQLELDLRSMGLEIEPVVAAEGSDFVGMTVEEAERAAGGRFFVVAMQRARGRDVLQASPAMRIEAGDGLTIVGRGGRGEALAGFAARRRQP